MEDPKKLRLMYNDVFTSESGVKVLTDLEARCNWRTLKLCSW